MSRIKQTATGMWKSVTRRVLGSLPAPRNTAVPTPVAVPEPHPKGVSYLVGNPIFTVPIDRCRYQDGRRYSYSEHHFLQYYRYGLPQFRRFYQIHQPSNIFEYFFLDAPRANTPAVREKPWFANYGPRRLSAEAGLAADIHGYQGCGPVSEERILSEAARLDSVLASIGEHGFRPEMGGHVRGYFMLRRDGQWVFTVREGFHRVAALVHLGFSTIDVRFHPSYPRFVEQADSHLWPMVRAGALTQDEADQIFDQFFREERQIPASDDQDVVDGIPEFAARP